MTHQKRLYQALKSECEANINEALLTQIYVLIMEQQLANIHQNILWKKLVKL